jgi:hypothetical protein
MGMVLLLSACGSFVEIRDPEKLSSGEKQAANELPVFDQRDVKRGSYKSLGDFDGYSCKNKVWDKTATKSAALKQLKLKAIEAGGNAVILDSCYGEGTTYSKNCWEAYTCSGTAVILGKDSLIQTANAQSPKFPDSPIEVSFSPRKKQPHAVAVVIGNARYLGENDIPNVTPAYADASGVKKYFRSLGVREGNIIFLKDASSAQMRNVFGNEQDHRGKLYNWVKPEISNVYVYYAGHGAPASTEGTAYLVPSDATNESIHLTGYPLATLYKNLSQIPAKSTTVILESCFSGTSQNGNVISRTSGILVAPKVPTAPKNITVISAGRANQIASWEQDDSHSLFTKYFLKGMSGDADVAPYGDGDGEVNYDELGAYLEGTMTYYARRYYGRDQNAQIVQRVQ